MVNFEVIQLDRSEQRIAERDVLMQYGAPVWGEGEYRGSKSKVVKSYGAHHDGRMVARSDVIGMSQGVNVVGETYKFGDKDDPLVITENVELKDLALPSWALIKYFANWHVAEEFRGQGLGTEMIRLGVEGLDDQEIGVGLTSNPDALKVVNNLGGGIVLNRDVRIFRYAHKNQVLGDESFSRQWWRPSEDLSRICDVRWSADRGPFTLPYISMGWRGGELVYVVMAETGYAECCMSDDSGSGTEGLRQGQLFGLVNPDLDHQDTVVALQEMMSLSDYSRYKWINILQVSTNIRRSDNEGVGGEKISTYDLGNYVENGGLCDALTSKDGMWMFRLGQFVA